MRILLTGGTGFIGRNLAIRLAGRGHACVVLARRAPSEYPAAPNVTYVSYSELELVEPVQAVVNLAGEWVVGRWTSAKKARILDSRIETTRRIVEWMSAQSSRPEVFLSASAVGIYGHRPAEALTETSPLDPDRRFRFEVCQAWEREASRAEALGIRTVYLRIGNVLDSNGGFVGILLPWLRRLPFFMRLSPRTVTPWISLPDALRMSEFALDDARVRGPLNVVGPHPATLDEITSALGRRLHRPVLGRVPDGVLRRLFGEFAGTFLDTQDVRPAKALALGFSFENPDLKAYVARM